MKSCIFAGETQIFDTDMSNVIRRIKVGGVTNIGEVSIPLSELTALVAPNNYGKSNVLVAVEFGVRFLTATPSQRHEMMSQRGLIPINTSMAGRTFEFEVTGTSELIDKSENSDANIR